MAVAGCERLSSAYIHPQDPFTWALQSETGGPDWKVHVFLWM